MDETNPGHFARKSMLLAAVVGATVTSAILAAMLLNGGILGWDPLKTNPVAHVDENGIEYGHDGAPLPPQEWR